MVQRRIRVQRDTLAIAEEEDADNAAQTLAFRMQGGCSVRDFLYKKNDCQGEVRGHAAVAHSCAA